MLDALARRLNREAGSPPVPWLYFFTDPARTPDPVAVAARLPRGAAVVFRHFGRPNRLTLARKLARVCRERRLKLLIAADPALARQIDADGVHWPEALTPRRRSGFDLETAAAHSRQALERAAAANMDAAILAPVFASRSPSAPHPLGPQRAGALARAVDLPVIALGGVSVTSGPQLLRRGFAGLAAIDALKAD